MIILIKLVRRVSHHPLLPPTGQNEDWRRKRHHSRTHLWKRKQGKEIGARKTKDRGQRLWQVRVNRYIVSAFMKLVAYKEFVLLLFIFWFFIEWPEVAKDEAQQYCICLMLVTYKDFVPWFCILISFMKDQFLELTQTWISHCLEKKDCHVWSRWVFFEFQVYKST